ISISTRVNPPSTAWRRYCSFPYISFLLPDVALLGESGPFNVPAHERLLLENPFVTLLSWTTRRA
ncbi:MAG: hypothetical protein ACKO81_11130, partial [Planctomycetota bacterium]